MDYFSFLLEEVNVFFVSPRRLTAAYARMSIWLLPSFKEESRFTKGRGKTRLIKLTASL